MSDQNCTESPRNKDLLLSELQRCFDGKLEAGTALDDKINMLVTAGSLVLGLFSTLGMLQVGPTWYWRMIIAFTAVYFGSLILLGVSYLPARHAYPIEADWRALYSIYVPLTLDKLYDQVIGQYLVAMKANDRILIRKAWAARIGMAILLVMLLVLSISRLILSSSI